MLMHGINVYDMSRVSTNYRGYYMDRDGGIYSAKASPSRLTRLAGSLTASGRYFTLNGRSYRHDTLKSQFVGRPDFKQEFSVGVDLTPAKTSSDRSHAASTEAGIAAKGYIIGRAQGNAIVLGSQPAIHLTLKSVNSEMERLANAHPGVKFVRLKVDGSVVAGGVRWE